MDIKSIKAFKGLRKNSNTSNNQDGYFSEMVNTVKDAKGRLHPYNSSYLKDKQFIPWFAEQGNTLMAHRYKNGVLRIDFSRHVDGSNNWEARPYYTKGKDYTPHTISCTWSNFCDASQYFQRKDSDSFSTAEVDMNFFINKIVRDKRSNSSNLPVWDAGVYKFDGEKFHRGGLPTPWTHLSTLPHLGGNKSYRTVYITPDFNGGMTISDYAEIELNYSGGIEPLYIHLDTDLDDFVGVQKPEPITPSNGLRRGVYPKSRDINNKIQEQLKFANGNVRADYPIYWLVADVSSVVPDVGGDWITLNKDMEGVNLSNMANDGWLIGSFMNMKASINGEDVFFRADRYDAFAFYIRPNLYLDKILISKKIRVYNSQTFMWEEISLYDNYGNPLFDPNSEYKTLQRIVNNFEENDDPLFDSLEDWIESCFFFPLAQTFIGNYIYRDDFKDYILNGFYPLCLNSNLVGSSIGLPQYSSSFESELNDTKRPILGQITYMFSDWYSTSTTKVQFPPMTSITNYKNLLVGCDDNAIYFSHTGLGGSIDMTSGQDNLVPPGTAYGRIVGVCGSEDFLLISRERKNYVLTGDLVNGGFLIHECDLPVAGMATATSAINAFNNRIIFLNREGVWEVSPSGNIRCLSNDILDLFNPLDPSNIRDWVKDELWGETTRVQMTLNPQEALLFIMLQSSEMSATSTDLPENLLSPRKRVYVLNLLDMTWGEIRLQERNAYGLHQSPGDEKTSYFGTTSIYKRNYHDSASSVFQQLRFDWMGDGSQALDKKISQLKFYGPLQNAGGITLKHWIDWKPQEITQVNLTKETGTTYQREKKLNPSVCKVYSFELSTSAPNCAIVLDQVDVEGHLVQSSIKSTRRKNQNE